MAKTIEISLWSRKLLAVGIFFASLRSTGSLFKVVNPNNGRAFKDVHLKKKLKASKERKID